MNIRQAISEDGPLLSSLCRDVQTMHAEHHPKFFKMPKNDDFAIPFFEGLLTDISVRIYIAEENEQALGYIVCKSMERVETPFTFGMRYLLIDQISVRPQARGRGVGKALIERAEVLAKEIGVQKVQLDSWDFNKNAHAFFEGVGFVKFMYRFWKEL